MSLKKLLIVSNRLPVNVSKENGKLVFSPSSGGLSTAMSSLKNNGNDQIWIGWPGIASDELTAADRQVITKKLSTFGCCPVFLTREQVKNFYEGYSNKTIWPLFHYFQSLAEFDIDYWKAYKQVNALFKKAIIKKSDEDSSIWIHDYHLMLLPQMLREELPKSSIGFFMHIPFPSYELFRLLPNRREILLGLLGADLIGFHIYDYARHFMSSVLRLLGFESHNSSIAINERVVKVDAFPLGIDYKKYKNMLKDPEVHKEIKILDEHYNDYKIILSMDRLDYSKGIINRLEAFEHFLKEYPQYVKKVVMVIIAVPSRTGVEAYQELRESIERMVSNINGNYATVDWAPISYQFKNLPFEQIIALLAKADIALVTPVRDGMNLVAKEYIASKQNRLGVLILSEMTGAIDELPEALQINPSDKRSISKAIDQALHMSKKDQKQRIRLMQRRLSAYSVQRWAASFISELDKTKKIQAEQNNKMLTHDEKHQLAKSFRSAKKRLLYLDYDGTLHNFVKTPSPLLAAPSRKLLKLLRKLAQLPNTKVCVVSGRTKKALESWFSDLPIILIAEHGAWIKESNEWIPSKIDIKIHKEKLLPILNSYAERTPGARVEDKTFSLVWHYRNVSPELAYVRNLNLKHDLNQRLANTGMDIFSGNKILEIKPRMIQKGRIVRDFLKNHPADFVLAIGDDYTDEDMFDQLPDSVYTLKVGLGDTHARHQIPSVEKVHSLLASFIEPTI